MKFNNFPRVVVGKGCECLYGGEKLLNTPDISKLHLVEICFGEENIQLWNYIIKSNRSR